MFQLDLPLFMTNINRSSKGFSCFFSHDIPIYFYVKESIVIFRNVGYKVTNYMKKWFENEIVSKFLYVYIFRKNYLITTRRFTVERVNGAVEDADRPCRLLSTLYDPYTNIGGRMRKTSVISLPTVKFRYVYLFYDINSQYV